MLEHQVIDQHSSTRASLAIHETQAVTHDIGEGTNERPVLAPYHHPLNSPRAADEVVQSRFEQRLQGPGEYRSRAPQSRHMKSRDETLTIVQGTQGIDTSLKTQFQMQVRNLRGVLLKYRKGYVVACADCEQLVPLIAGLGEHAGQIGAQCFDMRLHASARATLRPKQSLGELRRTPPLALRPRDERLAEHLLPFPERAPDITIRTTERLRGMSDRAAIEHRGQQFEKGIVERGATLLPRLERISQAQAQTGSAGGALHAARGPSHGAATGTRHNLCLIHPPTVSLSSAPRSAPVALRFYQGLHPARVAPCKGLQNLSSLVSLGRRPKNTPISIP